MNWNRSHTEENYSSFPQAHTMGPKGAYMAAVVVSMTASLIFKLLRKKHPIYIVGEWVAPFIVMGAYEMWAHSKGKLEYKK